MDVVVWQHIVWYMILIPFLVIAQQDSLCPAGWVHHDSSCYLLHQEKDDWFESQIVCAGHKSHLAIVTDAAENSFIKGLIINTFGNDQGAHVWLGAADDVIEGQFLWYGTDELLSFTDWGPNEPNSIPLHLNEDCLVYWAHYSWKWADLECHQKCYSVCEKDDDETTNIIG